MQRACSYASRFKVLQDMQDALQFLLRCFHVVINLQFVLKLLKRNTQETVVIERTNEIANHFLFVFIQVEEADLLL